MKVIFENVNHSKSVCLYPRNYLHAMNEFWVVVAEFLILIVGKNKKSQTAVEPQRVEIIIDSF